MFLGGMAESNQAKSIRTPSFANLCCIGTGFSMTSHRNALRVHVQPLECQCSDWILNGGDFGVNNLLLLTLLFLATIACRDFIQGRGLGEP